MRNETEIVLDGTPVTGSTMEAVEGVAEMSGAVVHPIVSHRALIPGKAGETGMKPSKFKIGPVTLKPLGGNRFQLAYADPDTRAYVRRRIEATRKEAEAIALHLSAEIHAGRGFLPRKKSLPSVKDAFAETIRLSGGNPETKRDYAKRASLFVRWLEARYPHVKTFGDMRPGMVKEYLRDLEKQGKAPDTIRLRLVPVRATWRHVSETYPEVRPLPRIRQAPPAPKEIESLEAHEVALLLDWLRDRHSDLWPIVALQSLAGLRLREVVFLRRQDLDMAKGLLSVTETPLHRPKNRGSFRTIPLCREALEALTFALNGQRIIPATGEIFLTEAGTPWGPNSLTSRFRSIRIQAATETGCPRLREVPIRKLRSSFVSMATLLSVPEAALRRYLGHAGSGILERHYQRIGIEFLRTVSGAFERWRDLIPARGNCKIFATGEGGNSVTS